MGYANRIIEYAHRIGKNTADFTVKDLCAFMREWTHIPTTQEIAKMTPTQRVEYNKDVAAMKQWREEETMKKHTTASYHAAQTSRLAERGIESPINDGQEEIVIHPENEIVAEMGLTKGDVEALKFAITRVLADYEMGEHKYGVSLKELLGALEGV